MTESISAVASPSTASSFKTHTIAGFPPGVWLLSFTELFERASYYGLLAILALYLSAGVEEGGFGWSDQSALKLYGLFSGLAFILPLLGGWIADALLGERRCLFLGAILILLGQGLIVSPWLISYLSDHLFALDFLQLLRKSGAPLGYVLGGEPWEAVQATAAQAGVSKTVAVAAYSLTSISFLGGLAIIVVGTGLFKPTISSLISRFYDDKHPRRDSAFALFLLGMLVGQVFGMLAAGYVGERVGWYAGFASAGFGIVLGLLPYLALQRRYLGDIGVGRKVVARTDHGKVALTSIELDRIKAIIIIIIFSVIFCTVVFQSGPLTLFAKRHVDLARWGWQIPAGWFPMVGATAFILFIPAVTWLLERRAMLGRPVRTSRRLVIGLIAGGLGHLIIAYPLLTSPDPDHNLISPLWLIITYMLFGLSETFVWAGVFSLTTKLAPKHLTVLSIGGIYLSMGVGVWLATYVGTFSYSLGVSTILTSVAVLGFSAAALLWLLGGSIARLTHGIED